ncbi:MAG TPA: ATP synthase F0 subunit C [Patescibacteria group bacterium]|nr:ATP synthase F0 subunit C [Patescibacteria group bacterium]
MGDPRAFVIVGCAIAAAIAVLVAVGAAISEGLATAKAVEAVGRQPEARKEIVSTLIIGNAITESNSIYGLLISLLIIFVLANKLG